MARPTVGTSRLLLPRILVFPALDLRTYGGGTSDLRFPTLNP